MPAEFWLGLAWYQVCVVSSFNELLKKPANYGKPSWHRPFWIAFLAMMWGPILLLGLIVFKGIVPCVEWYKKRKNHENLQ